MRSKMLPLLLVALLAITIGAPHAVSPARAQGFGNFLNGVWVSQVFETPTGEEFVVGQVSKIVLLNPTGQDRDAVVLFYGRGERFAGCDVRHLTPHDIQFVQGNFIVPEEVFLRATAIAAGCFELFGIRSCPDGPPLSSGTGHLEVRSEPADGSTTPGINGYTLAASTSVVVSMPLFVLDPAAFHVKPEDASQVSSCVCPRLKAVANARLTRMFCG